MNSRYNCFIGYELVFVAFSVEAADDWFYGVDPYMFPDRSYSLAR